MENDEALVNFEDVVALGASVILGHINAYFFRITTNLLSCPSHCDLIIELINHILDMVDKVSSHVCRC